MLRKDICVVGNTVLSFVWLLSLINPTLAMLEVGGQAVFWLGAIPGYGGTEFQPLAF